MQNRRTFVGGYSRCCFDRALFWFKIPSRTGNSSG